MAESDVTTSLIIALIPIASVLILWAVYKLLQIVTVAVWKLLGALCRNQHVGTVRERPSHYTQRLQSQGPAGRSRGGGRDTRKSPNVGGQRPVRDQFADVNLAVGVWASHSHCTQQLHSQGLAAGSRSTRRREDAPARVTQNIDGQRPVGEQFACGNQPVGVCASPSHCTPQLQSQGLVTGSWLSGRSGEDVPVKFTGNIDGQRQVGDQFAYCNQPAGVCASHSHYALQMQQQGLAGSWSTGGLRAEEVPIGFIQTIIDKFNGQREVGDQFAVVVLSRERELRDFGRMTFRPCDHTHNPFVNCQHIFYPPRQHYGNYVVARPGRRFWYESVHAEMIILSEMDSLLEAYRRAEGCDPTYILLYSWMMPCSECTSAIITLRGSLSMNSQIVVAYTIDWKGISEEENDYNRDWLYAAGIIVQKVEYDFVLPPAQHSLPVWPEYMQYFSTS